MWRWTIGFYGRNDWEPLEDESWKCSRVSFHRDTVAVEYFPGFNGRVSYSAGAAAPTT